MLSNSIGHRCWLVFDFLPLLVLYSLPLVVVIVVLCYTSDIGLFLSQPVAFTFLPFSSPSRWEREGKGGREGGSDRLLVLSERLGFHHDTVLQEHSQACVIYPLCLILPLFVRSLPALQAGVLGGVSRNQRFLFPLCFLSSYVGGCRFCLFLPCSV